MSRKTSSDIPRARELLNFGLNGELPLRTSIRRALHLMTRRSPDFKAPRQCRPLTKAQKTQIRALRRKGLSQLDIASRFHVHPGRISETVNGKLHKRRGHSRRATF
jgi:hypothetical protein